MNKIYIHYHSKCKFCNCCVFNCWCNLGNCIVGLIDFMAGWCKRLLNQVLVLFGLVCAYIARCWLGSIV